MLVGGQDSVAIGVDNLDLVRGGHIGMPGLPAGDFLLCGVHFRRSDLAIAVRIHCYEHPSRAGSMFGGGKPAIAIEIHGLELSVDCVFTNLVRRGRKRRYDESARKREEAKTIS